MTEPVYSRAPDVVWRLGPDRVLVRRIGATGEGAAVEFVAEAAAVWMAMASPQLVTESALLRSTTQERIEAAADELREGSWLSRTY